MTTIFFCFAIIVSQDSVYYNLCNYLSHCDGIIFDKSHYNENFFNIHKGYKAIFGFASYSICDYNIKITPKGEDAVYIKLGSRDEQALRIIRLFEDALNVKLKSKRCKKMTEYDPKNLGYGLHDEYPEHERVRGQRVKYYYFDFRDIHFKTTATKNGYCIQGKR